MIQSNPFNLLNPANSPRPFNMFDLLNLLLRPLHQDKNRGGRCGGDGCRHDDYDEHY